jgi:hypothetical protein
MIIRADQLHVAVQYLLREVDKCFPLIFYVLRRDRGAAAFPFLYIPSPPLLPLSRHIVCTIRRDWLQNILSLSPGIVTRFLVYDN